MHEVWPQEKPVLLRVSAEDYEPDGMHPDEMAKIVELVKPYVDVLDVSTGGVVPTPPSALFPGYQSGSRNISGSRALSRPSPSPHSRSRTTRRRSLCNGARRPRCARPCMLREPYWVMTQRARLMFRIDWPEPYQRGYKTRK